MLPFWVRVQFTPRVVGSLLMVATKSWVAFTGMIPLDGDTGLTEIAGTVAVAEPIFVVSVAETAETVTVRSFGGTVLGAV